MVLDPYPYNHWLVLVYAVAFFLSFENALPHVVLLCLGWVGGAQFLFKGYALVYVLYHVHASNSCNDLAQLCLGCTKAAF